MPPMSMIWPWSSPACATSGTRVRQNAALALLALVLLNSVLFDHAEASTIRADRDIQTAINSAKDGDTIIVGPGEHGSFEADRALTIVGQEGAQLKASIQKPAIMIKSDGVTISGFKILGVGKDTNAKFDYYMQNPSAAAGSRLDEPNAAVVVRGADCTVKNTTIFGAQVGILAENADRLLLQNMTMDSCDTGASILRCASPRMEGCSVSNCKKYGIDIEQSRDMVLNNNSIVNNTNGGILLKESDGGVVQDNIISANTFGLSLWNASFNQVRRNQANHNYYGILVTSWSNYNNITDNVADDNSRSEIVKGFGIGISLQENSSYNMLIRNTANRNFNGLEVSKGCKLNAVYDNNAADNKHGIRLNENRNNLIFGNNFYNNNINAYENISLNIWNTTIGNYYSDYRGADANADGIGDQPYSLPGPESRSLDRRPLIKPYREANLDIAALRSEVEKYAKFGPADDEIQTTRMENGVVVISRHVPSSPPKWSDSRQFDASAPPFQRYNDF